jgi:hypothetical protein
LPIDNSNRNSDWRHIGDCRRSIQISGLVVAVFFEEREKEGEGWEGVAGDRNFSAP